MSEKDKSFETKKAFGVGVLLKLTKYNSDSIKISSNGEKFTSNVSMSEMKSAVDRTVTLHNIKLKPDE
jgi:hypothetical protein